MYLASLSGLQWFCREINWQPFEGSIVINSVFFLLPLELFNFCYFCHNMSWCRSVWVYLFWEPLCFLYWISVSFFSLWCLQPYCLQKHFQFPFLFLLLLRSLLWVNCHTLYYFVGLYIAFFFFFLIWISVCCSGWVISIILSSRSFIHSPVLFILLFFAFSKAFASADEFSDFSWLSFLVSSYSTPHFCW